MNKDKKQYKNYQKGDTKMMESRGKALSHLRKSLRSGRGEEMPMQKVSVIAADEKGLEEGLNKAKEILPTIEKAMSKIKPEMEDESEKEDESMESPEHEMMEDKVEESEKDESEEMEKDMKSGDNSQYLDEMSPEELKAMVKSLKSRLNY